MQKLAVILSLFLICVQIAASDEVVPEQDIKNTKTYTHINYNRQDGKQTAKQKIVNGHSWFNINIQIIKEGSLFKGLRDTDTKQNRD